VRQIFPVAGGEFEVITTPSPGPLPQAVKRLADLYGNEAVAPATAGRPWLRANMISSADGAAALAGRSRGLGGPADRMVFGVLRSLADVILVGAGTARAERYRPVQPGEIWPGLRAGEVQVPPIAVVTSSLNLQGARLLDGSPPPILITTAAAAADQGGVLQSGALTGRAEIVTAGHDRVDAAAAVAALAGLGYRRILCEGGPHLLGQLAAARLLDELCLTTSPVLASGAAGRVVTGGGEQPTSLTLAHVLTHDGFLLARYVRSAA
jgi:riboflavin biosynthesis pyrimidine reductase